MYRTTTIFSRLNIGERLFLPDLTSEFGVSLRTIQKDFSARSIIPGNGLRRDPVPLS
jgi:predicted DNA-binding transcriptional regulator YafY